MWRHASHYSRGFFIFGEFWGLKRKSKIAALLTAGVFTLSVMPHGTSAALNSAHPGPSQNSSAAGGPPRATRIVTDESGSRVAIPVSVQRIVTLAPNLTETVYALGMEDKLAADTSYCDVPPAAKDKPHVGGPANPSLEAIVAMHPDLILATTMTSRQTIDSLRHLGLAVYFSDPHTVRAMLESTAKMADVMGAPEKGSELVTSLQARVDALQAKLAERPLQHVLFVVWEDPLITIGQNTFVADALRYAGGESVIVSSQDWPQVSMEEILRVQPDYIILTPDHAETDNTNQIAELRARGVWHELNAVKFGRVALATEEFIRPSPGLVAAIETLARQLHPEVFGSIAASPSTRTSGSIAPRENGQARNAEECPACGL